MARLPYLNLNVNVRHLETLPEYKVFDCPEFPAIFFTAVSREARRLGLHQYSPKRPNKERDREKVDFFRL